MNNKSTNGKITSNLRWIRKRELWFFMMVPVWLMGLRAYWKTCFLPMHDKILKLWQVNGSLWLTQYLALVSRIIILWIGGEAYKETTSSVRVGLSRQGLPLLLPGPLRKIFLLIKGEDQAFALKVIRVTLSTLSVYRVIGCVPTPKLSTITDGFSGVNATLAFWEVSQAVNMVAKSLVLSQASWRYLSESAGPNFKKSTWSAGLDALAFLYHPLVWWHWLSIAFVQRAWVLLMWNLFTIMVSLPVVPLLIVVGKMPRKLGKLVTLFEARGKVRIVAVTDWWTQALLSPLHTAIFNILKTIPQDGTFDQLGPVHRLLTYVRASGSPVYSYDLSAATDRLPIAFQVQVLKSFGIPYADSWAALLVSRPWYLKDQPIKYSVGQPIGALSSWAMLALSHHILVQIAAARTGVKGWFTHYALLGDDIVIADEGVAKCYLSLMQSLGVSINLSKSFEMVSGTLEFAKRWISPTLGDLSPMGPGLILAVIRNPRMLSTLIQDALNREFVFSSRVVGDLNRIMKFLRPSSWAKKFRNPILSSVIGPTGGLWDTASGLYFKAVWIGIFPHLMADKLTHLTELLFRDMALAQSAPEMGSVQTDRLVSNFWNEALLLGRNLWGWISAPLVLCSPAFWVYYDLALKGDEKLASFIEDSTTYYNKWSLMTRDLSGKLHPKAEPVRSVKALAMELVRDTFDSRLLDWNRKVAEVMLSYHTGLWASWDKYVSVETMLREDKERRDRNRSRNLFRKFYKVIPTNRSLVPVPSQASHKT